MKSLLSRIKNPKLQEQIRQDSIVLRKRIDQARNKSTLNLKIEISNSLKVDNLIHTN